ncbi:hypothetical protein K8R66_03155, partial [bacterium]|nr:hypothetical protein [bacterium]
MFEKVDFGGKNPIDVKKIIMNNLEGVRVGDASEEALLDRLTLLEQTNRRAMKSLLRDQEITGKISDEILKKILSDFSLFNFNFPMNKRGRCVLNLSKDDVINIQHLLERGITFP